METDPSVGLEAQRRGDEWRALDPENLNPGFTERDEARFRVPGRNDLRLLVDDEPITSKDGVWVWRPGFYAGEVRAEVLNESGTSLGVWSIDVSPDSTKNGRDLFDRMVNEILGYDPLLVIGAEPASRRLGALGTADDPLVALERLRRREIPLRHALAAVCERPRSVLRPRREWLPLHQVRRADLRTLRAVARHPSAQTVLGLRDQPVTAQEPERLPLLDAPMTERSLDSPANRTALAMLRALRRRADSVLANLEKRARDDDQDSETRTNLAARLPRWREVLERMSHQFRRVERRTPFREVTRAEITAAGLNAVAAQPAYARFWRLGWEAIRRGVDKTESPDELRLSPSWEIYERWCFVALARQLRNWLPESEWTRSDRTWGEAPDRRSANFRRKDGASVSLLSQRHAWRSSAGLQSVSCSLRPDLVIRWERGSGKSGFIVLDAKYRSRKRSILIGMCESAHLYQDALRWDGERPRATVLLVPETEDVAWLSRADFISENKVGTVALRPDRPLPDWFRERLLGAIEEKDTGSEGESPSEFGVVR